MSLNFTRIGIICLSRPNKASELLVCTGKVYGDSTNNSPLVMRFIFIKPTIILYTSQMHVKSVFRIRIRPNKASELLVCTGLLAGSKKNSFFWSQKVPKIGSGDTQMLARFSKVIKFEFREVSCWWDSPENDRENPVWSFSFPPPHSRPHTLTFVMYFIYQPYPLLYHYHPWFWDFFSQTDRKTDGQTDRPSNIGRLRSSYSWSFKMCLG